VGNCELDSHDSVQEPVAGSRERCNEPSGAVRDEQFVMNS
jgi:hypothetical protein